MSRAVLSRRSVLRGAGVLISLPVLESCKTRDSVPTLPAREHKVGKVTSALTSPAAKRFICVVAPNGVDPIYWFPTGGERDFVLNQQNAPLEAIRQHLIITSGIDNQPAIDMYESGAGNGHAEGVGSLLTGWAVHEDPPDSNQWAVNGGPSIDQTLSDMHGQNGYVGRARGLYMGDEGGSGSYGSVSVRENGQRENGFSDLNVLFDSNDTDNETALENARLRRKSVLDGSKADFAALVPRVSGEDKLRIEAHLEALRSIEMRYDNLTQCGRPDLNDNPMDANERRDMFQDIVVATMTCDASRVATLYLYHSGGGGPQLPFIDIYEDIHELSHQVADITRGQPDSREPAKARDDFTRYLSWFSEKTVSLVEKFKAVSTPEGTLFDDVVIFHGSEISIDHTCPNMPFMVFAGDNTPFDTGRYLQFPTGTSHTHLLTTLLNAFGHTATQVGDPRYPAGNLNAQFFKA